jgi:3-deoxy-D-manno-octulosonic-acid transferase
MTPGLFLYRLLTFGLSPFLGIIMRHREKSGKDDITRLNERFARSLKERPNGKLIWFHAASVGESKILIETAQRMLPDLRSQTTLLFTCQTRTAAHIITDAKSHSFLTHRLLQQMAPLDTMQISQRFIDHWQPDLAIFAEGEIWPNLLLTIKKRDIPSILINARMTEKSLKGWARWPSTARKVFGVFELIFASDEKTCTGLSALLERDISCPGNLKSSLPKPTVNEGDFGTLKTHLNGRYILLAASTHAPEEEQLLATWATMPHRPFLIIAPRHPERGDTIEAAINKRDVKFARVSRGDLIQPETEVLLADTIGQMGLWYRLADTVYLGGGHAPGVGGHNPIEALQLGKPVVTGPDLFNFSDLARQLDGREGFTIIAQISELPQHFPSPLPSKETLSFLAKQAEQPIAMTLAGIKPLLQKAGI